MEKAKAAGYRALVDRVRNGPPLGPFAVPGPAHAASTSRSTWCTTRTCGEPTASGHAPIAPTSQDALWGNLRRGARFLLRKVHGATVRLQRPGRRAPSPAATARRSWSPASRSTCCSTCSAAKGPPQVEITGDPEAQRDPRRAPRKGI